MSLDLEQVTHWMTLISLVSLIALGSFGCLCNILIFTSRQLRGNSCAFYFLCTAMVELSILGFGGITRLATEHFGSGLINYNQAFCKIRGYLNTTMSTISMYFVLLATIDRCMATSTHARCRAFSQIKVARRAAFTTTIILMALNVHNLVFFGLYPLCVPQPGAYSLFYSIYLMIHTSILPDGSILIFTLLTLRHVRQTRFRIAQNSVVTTRPNRQRRRMEKHLVLMMIAQASVSILVDFTRVSCYAYYFLTLDLPKSSYGKTVSLFIFQLSNVLFYINCSKSFYIYTLASRIFRRVFSTTIVALWRSSYNAVRTQTVRVIDH